MNKFFGLMALVAFSCAGVGCGASACDAMCDRADECAGTDVAETCKEGYAGATSAEQDACDTAIDAYDILCPSGE